MTATAEVPFVFVCPKTKEVFERSDFRIFDNLGVIIDETGQKILDAKVSPNAPCPFCGQRHVYHASELSCPFPA
ncbi:MAG: hypothetical protein ACK5PS_18685 [Desulfopila sp.]